MKVNVLVGTFNQEKALVGAFSVIVKTDGSFAALVLGDVGVGLNKFQCCVRDIECCVFQNPSES